MVVELQCHSHMADRLRKINCIVTVKAYNLTQFCPLFCMGAKFALPFQKKSELIVSVNKLRRGIFCHEKKLAGKPRPPLGYEICL
jgi:hypothetical protein